MGKSKNTDKHGKYRDFRDKKNKKNKNGKKPRFDEMPSDEYQG
jgi:hypothetical protein